MRKAFLGIALIAASFAGGAAANGPGLSWAQSLLGEFHARGSAEDDAALAAAEIAAAEGFPEAPPRALGEPDVEVPPEDSATVTTALTVAPTPISASTATTTPAPAPAPVTVSVSDPALALASTAVPVSTVAAMPPEVPAPPAPVSTPLPRLSPTPSPTPAASATAPVAASQPNPTPAPVPTAAAWSDAPDSAAPAGAIVPGSSAPVSASALGSASRSAPMADPAVSTAAMPPSGGVVGVEASGWSETCRRMRELGITKYWVEGEPSGAVRFRCLVPLAGEGAVSQQFEAEGDAVADAAEAALRRVALWRAAAAVSQGS